MLTFRGSGDICKIIILCIFLLEIGGGEAPRGVLWISSNKDYQRIFLGLKFLIPGFLYFLGVA